MYAFTLTCTDAACGALFEVFAPCADHGATTCSYCSAPLLDVSFLDPTGCPSDDDTVEIVIREGPLAARTVATPGWS